MIIPIPAILLLLALFALALGVDPRAKHALVAFTLMVAAFVTFVAPTTLKFLGDASADASE